MAARFWVGGTGTWDASDTTHWASSSNGAGGQTVPGSSDTVTFDGSSGGGTCTVNHATLNTSNITLSAYTGTLDFATNNNDYTMTGAWTDTGSGVHTINLGAGTFTFSSAAVSFDCAAANITMNAGTSTISFTNTSPSGVRTCSFGGKTLYNVNVAGCTGSNLYPISLGLTGGATVNALTLAGPLVVATTPNVTFTVSSACVWTGAGLDGLVTFGYSSRAGATKTTISAAGAITGTYCAIEGITGAGAGSLTFTNSFSLGGNSGANLTITPPTAGGRSSIIGG
jgi:hypothetical protein